MLIASAVENKKVFEKIVANATERSNSKADLVAEVDKTPEYNKLKKSSLSTANLKGHISFLKAWLLPGVILYSLAFFCTKMAVY
jgi:hypothetical protein